MNTRFLALRLRPAFLMVVPGLILALLLAACGSNTTTGSSPSSGPTIVKGYGTTYGCPSDAVVSNPQTPNVTIQPSQANQTITAHNGDVIQINLPFGSKWSGPTTSQGILELQTPAGYAQKSINMCVWQFIAKGTGTVQLSFQKQALCKPGTLCPQYILVLPFTVNVQ
jgi:hypothetical protein